ncbi:hypothetical protein EV193_103710 [Herbihabitans rhizosphaerae]|uniref:MOSC domain-containing protein n=1 Tax=Herbihabitans rhizosphaerae TaxID=1872711 RepID=A0A4Q7KXD3_9PSEU|nr:MOSC N-terminal beta barrel domain-containing protein [Herbihabitans rhizosphaerae]RZS41387.1 hypothetical protein EV193_103710 [Herbihabitans rhizosphaerae]
MAEVVELTYYPIKGCTGVPVERATVTETGLRHDRSFMLVDGDGAFVSQRGVPAMAAIRVAVHDGGARLALSALGADDASLDVLTDGPRRDVSIFNKWFGSGVDQGDVIAKWFSSVLDAPYRLVRVPPEHDRDGWGVHPGKVGFADAHAVLTTSVSSLDGLNARMAETGGKPLPMNRFRPNIVVSGWAEPHLEDRVRGFSAGTVHLGHSTRAARCAVPTVDQATGLKDGPEPTRTLAGYRRDPDLKNKVTFGVKMAVLRGGEIAVGDEITVHDWLD